MAQKSGPTFSVQNLVMQLDTQSDKKAEQVVALLIQAGTEAIPLVMKAAQDHSAPRIRKWALLALGAMKVKKAAPVLLEALGDERMTIRMNGLRGLAKLKHKKAVKEVAALLKDESGGIRVNALATLIAFGDASVALQIQKTLLDPQWYVRQTAAEACGILKIQKSKRKLLQLSANDERKAVRTAADKALTLLQK